MSHTILTTRVVVIIIALLTYIWLMYWFLNYRHHFLSTARHSVLTFISSLVMHVLNVYILIVHMLKVHYPDHHRTFYVFENLSVAFAFASVAIPVYRLLLVYDDWMVAKFRLVHKKGIIVDSATQSGIGLMTSTIEFSNYKNYSICSKTMCTKKSFNKSVAIFIVVQFVFFCFAFLSPVLLMVRALLWSVFILISCVILYKTRKIEDNLSCIYETCIVCSVIVAQLISSFVFMQFMSRDAVYLINTIELSLVGNLFIAISVFMVFKSENPTTLKETATPAGAQHVMFYEYLRNEQNYEQFAKYLTSIFAIENLLYFVRVILFRHSLLNMLQTNDENCQTNEFWESIFGLKFAYVAGGDKICKMKKSDDIHKMALRIYNQFISDDAPHQVNISAEHRQSLDQFFVHQSHDIESVKQGDYLKIFNDSAQEIYFLMKIIYDSQYKAIIMHYQSN